MALKKSRAYYQKQSPLDKIRKAAAELDGFELFNWQSETAVSDHRLEDVFLAFKRGQHKCPTKLKKAILALRDHIADEWCAKMEQYL